MGTRDLRRGQRRESHSGHTRDTCSLHDDINNSIDFILCSQKMSIFNDDKTENFTYLDKKHKPHTKL